MYKGVIRLGQVLTVVSGKGGTGKTSICAAVAVSLACMGQRVLCVDADIGLRNLDLALGMAELPILPFTDLLSKQYGLEDAARHPSVTGLFLLTAPIRQKAEEISLDAFGELIEQARQQFEWIFIDAGAGVGAGFTLATTFADRILVVANADPASLRDAAFCTDLLYGRFDGRMHLIVNRVRPKLLKKLSLTIDDVMDGVGLPLLGVVPEDANVVLATASGKALTLQSPKGASIACANIARRLCGQRVRLMQQP